MKRARRLVVVAALGIVGFVGRADAQSASGAAEKLFREGKALLVAADKMANTGNTAGAAQKYDEAIEKFRASEELEAKVGVLIALGDAYRARGKVASAWGSYVSAKDLAKKTGDDRVTDATQRADEILPRVPRLTIRVATPVRDVSVTDNGLTLPAGSYGSPLPVDPGAHAIVATEKGKEPFKTTVELADSQSREVVIPVLTDVQRPAEPPPAPVATTPDGSRRTVANGLLVGGGAVTVVGLVFGGLAISKWSSVTDTCPDKHCPSEDARSSADGERTTANTFATVSTVTVAIGLVAVATGLVLRLTEPSKSRSGAASRDMAIAPTFNHGPGVGFTFRH